MVPVWLHDLAILSLAIAGLCAAIVVLDEIRHPQKMWIMNCVWPLAILFGSLVWTWGYFTYGRSKPAPQKKGADQSHGNMHPPFPVMVAKAASHCGAGCTLGDIIAELVALAFPGIAILFGWQSLFEDKIFAVWILDFLVAYGLGIVFQYFTIAPMRGLSPGAGIIAALKADTLSLIAWQLGMYGFMAFAHFIIFRGWLHVSPDASTPEFWFAMQIAMLFGFATSFPVNWWLLKAGLKEKM